MTVYVSMMLEQIPNYFCYFLQPFYLSSYKTPTLFFLIFQRNLSVSSSFSSLDTASQWLSSHRSLSQDIGWNMWSKKGKLINTEQKTASQVHRAQKSHYPPLSFAESAEKPFLISRREDQKMTGDEIGGSILQYTSYRFICLTQL